MLKGVKLDGSIRDWYLQQHQIWDNEIEYLKVSIQASAALGDHETVGKQIKILAKLLAITTSDSNTGSSWMDDPEEVKRNMELLQSLQPRIEP